MKTSQILTQENALFAAKIALGIVVVGGAAAGAGYLVEKGGTSLISYAEKIDAEALKTLGSWLEYGGQGLFTAGKYTAYSILVPAYAVGYELPKWVINKGLPALRDHVLVPFCKNVIQPALQKVEWLVTEAIPAAVEKVTQLAKEWIFVPLYNKIHWVATQLQLGVEWLANKGIELIHSIAKKVHALVLPIWNSIVLPVLKNVKWFITEVIPTYISKIAQFARDQIFIPLSNAIRWTLTKIQGGLEWLLERGIEVLQKGFEIIEAIWNATIVPLYTNVILPILQNVRWVLTEVIPSCIDKIVQFARDQIFIPLSNAARWTLTQIQGGLEWLLERGVEILQKGFEIIEAIWNATIVPLYTNVLLPIFENVKWLATEVIPSCINKIRDKLFTPLFNAVKEGFLWVAEKASALTYQGITLIQSIAKRVLTTLSDVTHAVIQIADKILFTPLKACFNWVIDRGADLAHFGSQYLIQPAIKISAHLSKVIWENLLYPSWVMAQDAVTKIQSTAQQILSSIGNSIYGVYDAIYNDLIAFFYGGQKVTQME